jgi:hypothetical protein
MLLILVAVILVSRSFSNYINELNLYNIYASDDMIVICLYILNKKYDFIAEDNSITEDLELKMTNSKSRHLSSYLIIFNKILQNILITHKSKCIFKECEICQVKSISYDCMLSALINQIKKNMKDEQTRTIFSDFSIYFYDYLKLLVSYNKEKDKKVKLIYKNKSCIAKYAGMYNILNNLILFFDSFYKGLENTKKFILIKNYYDTNTFIRILY